MTDATSDLELRLSAYYRELTPGSSHAVSNRAARTIRSVRAAEPVSGRVRFLPVARGWALLVGTALVLTLIVALVPIGLTGPVAASSTPPRATVPPNIAESSVQEAGVIPRLGFWALTATQLFVSADGGATWRAGRAPSGLVQGTMTMIDPTHGWALVRSSTTGTAAPETATQGTAADPVALSVARTTDGGVTWATASLPSVHVPVGGITFLDANDGFALLVDHPEAPGAVNTLFRTDDGGKTWREVASTVPYGLLGWQISTSDPSTLWAAAVPQTTLGKEALLAVSRDAGQTWGFVHLPGYADDGTSGGTLEPLSAPVFSDARTGLFAVRNREKEHVDFYATADGGQTWRLLSTLQDFMNAAAWAAGDAQHLLYADTTWLFGSTDGGGHWKRVAGDGIPDGRVLAWLGLADARHGIGLVPLGLLEGPALYVTSDGGGSWTPARFGDALAVPSQGPAADEIAVRRVVDEFEVARSKGVWASAWAAMSPFSQRAFGSIAAFTSWQTTINTGPRGEPNIVTVTAGVGDTVATAFPALSSDVASSADASRAYTVTIARPYLPGDNKTETLIVAPLVGGTWRIWLARS